MKKTRSVLIITLVIFLLLGCTGCGALLEKFEDTELRGYTDEMLRAIMNGDAEAAYALVDDVCSEEEFGDAFETLSDMLSQLDSYELQLASINSNTYISAEGSPVVVSAAYLLSSEVGNYVVDVQRHSDYEQLSSFYVTEYKNTGFYSTGTLNNMADAGLSQWLVLILLNLVGLGLMVYALVDCCRKNVKKKVLIILLVIFITTTVSLSIGGGVFFNLNFGWITSYSALIKYGNGNVVFRLFIPLGAIIYFCIRKKLLPKEIENLEAETEQQSEE